MLTATRKYFLLCVLVTCFIIYVFHLKSGSINTITDHAVGHIADLKEKLIDFTLGDPRLIEHLFKAKKKPQYDGKSIFFLETHFGKENKNISLLARQACCVEAAGKP